MRLTDAQREVVAANIDLVPFVVKKYLNHILMDYDDKVSIGYYALCKAAISYKHSAETAFSTYAAKTIISKVVNQSVHDRRLKRGGSSITLSIDEMCKDDGFEIVDSSVDVECEALNRIICEPLWEMVPEYLESESSRLSQCSRARANGVASSTLSSRKTRQLKAAKNFLEQNGINNAV